MDGYDLICRICLKKYFPFLEEYYGIFEENTGKLVLTLPLQRHNEQYIPMNTSLKCIRPRKLTKQIFSTENDAMIPYGWTKSLCYCSQCNQLYNNLGIKNMLDECNEPWKVFDTTNFQTIKNLQGNSARIQVLHQALASLEISYNKDGKDGLLRDVEADLKRGFEDFIDSFLQFFDDEIITLQVFCYGIIYIGTQ